jgi:site-specific DNA-methyltransferase (adenine-specific)
VLPSPQCLRPRFPRRTSSTTETTSPSSATNIPDQSVDLIYLDPPFNSRQDYNVLFAEKDGARSASQITAFKDTWEWNEEAARSYESVVEQGGRVAEAMRAFRTLLGGSDMLAYLAMMAPRLVELRRVLKESGSIYLHCDPTASHPTAPAPAAT